MLFRASLSFAAVAALVASSIAACSSTDAAPTLSPESGTCETYVPPAQTGSNTVLVSFTNDVVPLVNRSCALASCHGSVTAPAAGMYLGPELSKMYLNLVDVASTYEPSMVRVKASDPANSVLQHRIDGDACTLIGCTDPTCAELMPQGQDLMAVNDRLVFRNWILQGAKADFTIVSPDAGAGDDAGGAANDAGDAGTQGGNDAGDASGE